ncbi:MAG: CHAD domain-containing protein [Arenimonas sp.]|uniref:CHAD domain-containing protein n=1 Tax=Arenimonas sp. TaxID=1872635 RepID=UPI0025C66714|nr:CHAD domain-containing protein [Arenimonas sp.]MBW8367061.1 CHAD domain-containing protein [Arenimonas sp.]
MTKRTAQVSPAPPAAAAKPVSPLLPLGLRLKAFALSELAQAQALLGAPGDQRHTGVHQARKCLRRTRAALALGRKALGREGRRLDEDLGRLCRGLSPLRDAQALIEGLQRLPASGPSPLASALPEMVALARARRDACLARSLARDPELQRRRDRLQAMTARLAALDWDDVKRGAVAKAVARSEKRLAKARRRASRHPGDDARWHAMRRRLRRVRQQDHLLAAIEPDLRPVGNVTAEEAAVLGEAQDDALLLRHCGSHSPFPPPLRKLLRAEARTRLGRVRTPSPPETS